jgi:hypothetical protein
MSVCAVIQLDDYRLAVCDCCVSPVRRKDLSLVSRTGYSDNAEICQNCITNFFNDEHYKITERANAEVTVSHTGTLA